jgi:hypothetical protein
MNPLIGWAIAAYAEAGEWLLLPLGIAAGWVLYRLTARAIRRSRARRAERDAHWQVLIAEARARDAAAINAANDKRPGTNQADLNECEAIWQLEPRKEDQQ